MGNTGTDSFEIINGLNSCAWKKGRLSWLELASKMKGQKLADSQAGMTRKPWAWTCWTFLVKLIIWEIGGQAQIVSFDQLWAKASIPADFG